MQRKTIQQAPRQLRSSDAEQPDPRRLRGRQTASHSRTSVTEGLRPYRHVETRLAQGAMLTTTAAASARLAKVRRTGTAPELAVRRAASALGLRYTLDNRDLPGSPDLANRSQRFAIFVHGCFWHRHTNCPRTTIPRTNRAFWEAKFRQNRARDREAIRRLKKMGYSVVILWECEAKNECRVVGRLGVLIGRQASARHRCAEQADRSPRRE